MRKYLFISILAVFVVVLVLLGIKAYSWLTCYNSYHTPTKNMEQEFKNIESTLQGAPLETISGFNGLLSDLVAKEDGVTSLLEQKASTQMGTMSIIITIILAIIGLLTKDSVTSFSKNEKKRIFYAFCLTIAIFLFSIYATHFSYVIRSDFASYNLDDTLDTLKESKSFIPFQISNILANYQIYKINSQVNECKANWLAASIWSFMIGLFIFSCICLVIVAFKNNLFRLKKEN
jgi:hypothetical protein